MVRVQLWFICVGILLAAAILSAGCSNQASQETPVITQTPTPTPTPVGPKFSDGAVITTSGSGSVLYYLILGYDSATDKYSVAQIKQNPSGRWGYRPDDSVEMRNRAAVENIYKVQVTTVDPDAVEVMPTATPTPVPTSTSIKATATATPVPTSTATTAATTAPSPLVKKVEPDRGVVNTNVTDARITGMHFLEGATVQLTSSGNTPINGTNVEVVNSALITCDFVIGDVSHTAWNVVVTNPDGKSGILSNYFTISSSG